MVLHTHCRTQGAAGNWCATAVVLLATVLLGGCSAGHYAHLIRGHYELLSRRVPIAELLADPATPDSLRASLREVQAARAFSVATMRLPDNGSYTQYADLGRPYVQWSVFAAPELSLEPRQWCYLWFGCFAYRGYYDEVRARNEASALAADGYETYVGGIRAYSTLGWFDDPVLNTMLSGPSERTAGLLFHELAHQRLHVRDDTAFNESFAAFVGRQGVREFLRGQPARLAAWQVGLERTIRLAALMLETRAMLESVYLSAADDDTKRRLKRDAFAGLREHYAVLRGEWGGAGEFDGWFSDPLNNARLLPFGLYERWVPAFAALYRQAGSDWPAFYRLCEELAQLESAPRQAALDRLLNPDYDEGRTTKGQ